MTPHPLQVLPKALKKGDKIALVSPSFRLNEVFPSPLERGQKFLESLGFEVEIFYTSLGEDHTIAQSIHTRRDELHAAFQDPSVAAVMCTIGGSHANELLPFLDYNLIRDNPKIFIGYSDITFLHWGIQSQTGLRTFYGPDLLTSFAELAQPLELTVDHFFRVLTTSGPIPIPIPHPTTCTVEHPGFLVGEDPEKARELVPSPPWRWLRGGHATGRLYGGTIICVARLQGTKYAPATWKNKILFLESAMGGDTTAPYDLDEYRNNLVDLALGGVLNEISGLVIGRGYKYDEKKQDELAGVIVEIFDVIVAKDDPGAGRIPILMNVDTGHTGPMVTLPFDGLARLDSEADEFVLLEAGVSE